MNFIGFTQPLSEHLYGVLTPDIRMIKSRWLRWVWHVEPTEDEQQSWLKNLDPRDFGRPGHRWEYNIKMDPKTIRAGDCDLDEFCSE
jgi:hypothetical protein